MMPRCFLRLDSASPDDMLTDAAVHVLSDKGAVGLTIKAVADWLRVTPGRVSQLTKRDHMVFVVAARFANRWLDWIEQRCWSEGAAAFLPTRAEEVAGVRVWLALCELARERPELNEVFERARRRERDALFHAELGLEDPDLDLVLATIEGLRVSLCEPAASVSVGDARATLVRLLGHLGAAPASAA
jgi:hypothetical protein